MKTLVISLCSVLHCLVLWDSMRLTNTDALPSCKPEDFHYEYTQCDSEGGRWRVSVPAPGLCTGGSPNAPVRGKGCDFTCKAGEYLDIENDQECHPCPAGHFSLGGGVRYEDFDGVMPKDFHTELEGFTNLAPQLFQPYFGSLNKANCSSAGWQAKDDYLTVEVHDCTAVLVYTANLVQGGSVSFVYQNEDEDLFFSFEVQNSQCQSSMDSENGGFLKPTKRGGDGKRETFELKSGLNVLYWRAFKPTLSAPRGRATGPHAGHASGQRKLTISSIDIIGVAYTSACTQCKAGTYSLPGSSFCDECPENTYSSKGAKKCFKCDELTEYAEPGSDHCSTTPACTDEDYYQYYSPCDNYNSTQKIYKWIQPQRCRTDLSESVSLPPPGPIEPCPPCNPGMEFKNGSCRFCPLNHYSTGSGPCTECPGSTAPQTGILYKWWNTLGEDYNITANCLSSSGRGCASKEGWIPSGDHINTGLGHRDDVYLMLNLRVGGFRGREEVQGGHPLPVGKISFLFELDCNTDCHLTFMQRNTRDGIALIESWTGRVQKTVFEYDITRTSGTVFTWAFQKSREPGTTGSSSSLAKIYMINVTNTITGGAQECRPCPKGPSQHGCIPCPDGHYVDQNTTRCAPCPAGKVAHGLNPWGIESCMACGSGLAPSQSKSSCVTSCQYNDLSGRKYDYSQLASMLHLNGLKLFTSGGYKYYHQFRISLCGGNGKYPLAYCPSNVTRELYYTEDETSVEVRSPICRITILPTSVEASSSLMYTQPISLGDILVAVTHNETGYNISRHKQEAGFMKPDLGDSSHDVHFVFASDSVSSVCPDGLRTILTLRCDLTAPNHTEPLLPSQCVTGTCDGCNYVLLWRSRYACPRCDSTNFTEFTDMCIDGRQKVLKLWPKDCYSDDGSSKELVREQDCSMLWQDRWPLWLKAVVICVPVVLISGCIMLIIVLHCWMKNRKLQYKYMKLVASSSGRPGGDDDDELPGVETCALDEGEDDEQFDQVQFKTKGRKIFTKFGHLGRRKDRVGDLNMEPMDERTRLRSEDK